jgi:hypothetical protein
MEEMERNAIRWQMGFNSAFEGLNKGLDKKLKLLSLLVQLFFFTTVINIPHIR